MSMENVRIKHDTRNHQGFFVPYGDYTLVDPDRNGWAYICVDNARCYYVDPDALTKDV